MNTLRYIEKIYHVKVCFSGSSVIAYKEIYLKLPERSPGLPRSVRISDGITFVRKVLSLDSSTVTDTVNKETTVPPQLMVDLPVSIQKSSLTRTCGEDTPRK